jgi:hypothetical protein
VRRLTTPTHTPQSVLQAKSLSELLGKTLKGENQLKFFFTWLVFALWILLTLFWCAPVCLPNRKHHSIYPHLEVTLRPGPTFHA